MRGPSDIGIALVAARIDARASRRGNHFLHVRRRWRNIERLRQLQHEVFEAGGSAQDQDAGRAFADYFEAVRNSARAENIGAGTEVLPLAVQNNSQFAFDHIKRFIFAMMNVIGRGESGRNG
jgi:hypothetical protein